MAVHNFGVRHYAGEVRQIRRTSRVQDPVQGPVQDPPELTAAAPCWCVQVVYDVRGMLQKNRDTFRDDVLNLLRDSRSVSSPSSPQASVSDGRRDDAACVFQAGLRLRPV